MQRTCWRVFSIQAFRFPQMFWSLLADRLFTHTGDRQTRCPPAVKKDGPVHGPKVWRLPNGGLSARPEPVRNPCARKMGGSAVDGPLRGSIRESRSPRL